MNTKDFLKSFNEGFMCAAGIGLAIVLLVGSCLVLIIMSILIGHYTFQILGWLFGLLGVCVGVGTVKALDETGWFNSYARFFGL